VVQMEAKCTNTTCTANKQQHTTWDVGN
jgi:hypothetical protein